MKLQMLQDLKNRSLLLPIFFNPKPVIFKTPPQIITPSRSRLRPTRGYQRQNVTDLHTDIQDRFGQGAIEVPRPPEEKPESS